MPLPGDETLPDNDDNPLLGSGLSFLNAPSAEIRGKMKIMECYNVDTDGFCTKNIQNLPGA